MWIILCKSFSGFGVANFLPLNNFISHYPPAGRHWRMSKEKYERALNDNRIIFGKAGKTKPQYKRFENVSSI
jgi:hypothetical protein